VDPRKLASPPQDERDRFEIVVARVARAAIDAYRRADDAPARDLVEKSLMRAVRKRLEDPQAVPEPNREAYLFTAIVLTLAAELEAIEKKPAK